MGGVVSDIQFATGESDLLWNGGGDFSEKQQFYLAFSKSIYYYKKVLDTNKNTASEKSLPEV